MIGQYVEIGIHPNGHEGTVDLAGSHARGGASADIFFGFVADPDETGWVDYNGDFYTPGSPENGFGVYVDGMYYHNNGMLSGGPGWGTPVDSLEGSITYFLETTDSIYCTWVGDAGDLELTIDYVLRKDEHFYTTYLSFANTGTSPLADVYYYRNLDPDNNQSIGAGFVTSNVIVSQGSDPSEISEVTAFQTSPWYSEFTFVAAGDYWRAYTGGFSNREAPGLFLDTLAYITHTVDDTIVADQAIGLALQIGTMPTGKAAPFTTSFITRFKPGATGSLSTDEYENPLTVFPNVTSTNFQINLEGQFDYLLIDASGKIVAQGNGTDTETVDVASLPNGIYFLKARTDKAFHTEKIMKQ